MVEKGARSLSQLGVVKPERQNETPVSLGVPHCGREYTQEYGMGELTKNRNGS